MVRVTSGLAMLVVAMGLSACGSGGGNGNFDALMSEADQLAARYGSDTLTPSGRVPASGTATYDGVAVYNDGELASDAQLRADFTTDRMTARMSGFTYRDGTALTGTLTMGDGRIAGNRFGGTVDGSITGPGGTGYVDGDLDGGFVGSNAEAAVAVIDATLHTRVGSGPLVGVIISEK